MSSASQNSDRDLGFATANKDLRDFWDQFDPTTENGQYLTTENINDNRGASKGGVLGVTTPALFCKEDDFPLFSPGQSIRLLNVLFE